MLNYCVISNNDILYRVSYGDIAYTPSTRYSPLVINENRPKHCLLPKANYLLLLIHNLHFSKKINKFINIPFKFIWFDQYFDAHFDNDNRICFVIFSRNLHLMDFGLLKYLRIKYPGSKMVCFFQDLVRTHEDINLNIINQEFDLIISFDQLDARINNFEYFPLVNSYYHGDLSSSIEESDVFFLGAAKDRLTEIIKAYEVLRSKNLRCSFFITGVPKCDRVYSDTINYIDSMSYVENLKHIYKTKCLLELMQKNGHGYTQRMMEAVIYDKKIITNNTEIMRDVFYDPLNIFSFRDFNELSVEEFFFDDFQRSANHNFKKNISPFSLFEFIESKLN